MTTGRLQYIGLGLATAAAYIVSAKLGLTLAFVAEQVTVVWPPTGIALCAVLLLGYRIWPFIALGAFVANITTNAPLLTSLGIATGNTLEALTGAYLLNRFVGFDISLRRFRDVFGLIFFGAIASTMVSATIGVISLCVTGIQPWDRFGPLWFVWFLGDAMGNIIVAPFVLTLRARESRERLLSRGLPEFGLLIGLVLALDLSVFAGNMPASSKYDPLDYAVFPLLIWAALRFGAAGTAITTLITATIAVLGTVQGFGPFTAGTTNENLISLQLFMFVAAVTGLIIAVSQAERETALTAAYRSEQRYRSLVLASSQVVWSTTAAGEVIEDLPTWRAFSGQTKEELMGRGWMRMLHPDDIQKVGDVWERSLATGTPHVNEFRVMSADGTYRTVSAHAVPIQTANGAIYEWVGALTDITDKKNAEQAMREASRRKDEFLAMLAHELRNPLAPIRNAVEILRSSKSDPARIDWICEVMERQVHHMSRLLDDLLDVARVTRGQIQLTKVNTDLTRLVQRSVESNRTVAEKKPVKLVANFVAGAVPISADVTRIEQVINNLLNNAVKFTPAGGVVTLRVERDADWAVLRVADTGRGITPELLPFVFDVFTQGHRSLARSEGGLGIGLTVVQSLVRMHGGSVEARSSGPGQGAEFVVRLPMLPVTPAETRADPQPSVQAKQKKRVLVVEDNVDSAQTLATMLELMGHDVHVAHDGPAGLAVFTRVRPSVVLLDIGLPGMSGYEVAERLRAAQPDNNLKIIALTGYGSDSDRDRSKAAGFDHHCVKPLDFGVLEKLLAD